MPPTIEAVVLLGWIERDDAVSYLQNLCYFDPPHTNQQAQDLWAQYRQRVEALPEREIQPLERVPIPADFRRLVNDFLARHRGPEVREVINLNPMGLLVYQMYVITEIADGHAQQAGAWARKSLVIDRPIVQMPVRVEADTMKITLPHAEHMIGVQPDGAFRIQQGGGFVSVAEIGGRLLLKAGYHRSFAFARAVMNEPDARDKCELVALTNTLPPQLSAGFPHQGLRTTLLGSRPPLFSDFFDADLVMQVRLRKKRFEVHIKMAQVDEP